MATAAVQNVRLQSKGGEVFGIDREAANKSVTLKKMLEEIEQHDGQNEAIPLENINPGTLQKVIAWCEYYRNKVSPTESEEGKWEADVPEWDQEFMKIDNDKIFEIILAANYLEIKGLLHAACKMIAMKIKDKTPEEIRKEFDIKDGFKPKENAEANQNGDN